MSLGGKFLAGVAALGLAASVSVTAQADYTFNGSGVSGNFTGQATEPWFVNYDFQFGGTQPDWGSPGVSHGTTPYLEANPAFGMDLNFLGQGLGAIDSVSIGIGNSSNCLGTTTGGTTFCTIGSPNDIWIASLTSPDSISFRAQDATFFLANGQDYFVNVFFDGTAAPTSFNGVWLTEFSPTTGVPEPAAFPLLAAGLGLMAWFAHRKKRKTTARSTG
jgi:hypothetical protein